MGNEHCFNPHSQLQILRVISDIDMHCIGSVDCNFPTFRKNPAQHQICDEHGFHNSGDGCISVLQYQQHITEKFQNMSVSALNHCCTLTDMCHLQQYIYHCVHCKIDQREEIQKNRQININVKF